MFSNPEETEKALTLYYKDPKNVFPHATYGETNTIPGIHKIRIFSGSLMELGYWGGHSYGLTRGGTVNSLSKQIKHHALCVQVNSLEMPSTAP